MSEEVVRPHLAGDLAELVVGQAQGLGGQVEGFVVEVHAGCRKLRLCLHQGIDMTGSGTNSAVTSSARLLPDSFSADMKASRGVVSNLSNMWQ